MKILLTLVAVAAGVGLPLLLLRSRSGDGPQVRVADIPDAVFQELETNGVRFLRIEDGDLAGLGLQIAGDLYGLGPNAGMSTVIEGFNWRPPAR